MTSEVLTMTSLSNMRSEMPTGKLRFAIPDETTTNPPRLQQQWHWKTPAAMGFEWRDVPTVVVVDAALAPPTKE